MRRDRHRIQGTWCYCGDAQANHAAPTFVPGVVYGPPPKPATVRPVGPNLLWLAGAFNGVPILSLPMLALSYMGRKQKR